jgi:hypothetical protein
MTVQSFLQDVTEHLETIPETCIGWIGTRQIQTKRNISRVIPYFHCKRILIDSPIRIFNTIRTSTISFHIVHNNSCRPYFIVIQIWVGIIFMNIYPRGKAKALGVKYSLI